jgi:predicted MPP superfamily phosphohydrolase
MPLFALLLLIEVLTFIVLKQHFYKTSRPWFYVSIAFSFILSFWLWYLLIKAVSFKGFFDDPENIRIHLNLTGMFCAIVFPRVVLIFLHFTGRLFRLKKGNHSGWMTNTGMTISFAIMIIIASGSFIGRYNFKTEEVTIRIKGLNPGLNGMKIVQISDLHLGSFNNHLQRLRYLMEKITTYKPDIIVNTGDFVSYGWREFDRCDTILTLAKSRYGNFAVMGNHDMGTYMPNSSEADKKNIVLKMNELITGSGYRVLNDDHTIININGARVELIGIKTSGRHPAIVHGNLSKALDGSDSADFKILLSHDPNEWEEDVTGKTDIDLTFSGHTHGMQIGILTKKFKWSPSEYFYPHWYGLFSEGRQYQYVNRGLGVLAIPFRIWMPPEITILTLQDE